MHAMASSVVDRACSAFKARFGRRPSCVGIAPGRVNLIGEHTDYSAGYVLPLAIDRFCAAVGGPAAGENGRTGGAKGRVVSLELGCELVLELGEPLRATGDGLGDSVVRGSPMSEVAGVIAAFQRAGALAGGFDLVIASDVPLRAGLSSSAAVEVAVASVLEEMGGIRMEPVAKAILCQHAEHEFGGVPCGIMDQFAAVFGRRDHALLIDCRSLEVRPVGLPSSEQVSIVVVNSMVKRSLADGAYARRREACERAAAVLRVAALRDANAEEVLHARDRLDAEAFGCAMHVVEENERTKAAAHLLGEGDVSVEGRGVREVGELMFASHESLAQLFKVSCEELDVLVDLAREIPGIYGARMTGAGFGGCMVALAATAAVEEAADALTRGYSKRTGLTPVVQIVRGSEGASSFSI